MHFVPFFKAAERIRGKRVAVVGSAPTCLDNEPGFVDGHDVVCRANNYKLGPKQGMRCDVHYSFYGSSIKKSASELWRDGVKLCFCKCPDAKTIDCQWHEQHGKQRGIDFRYIYELRKDWWFCDTFVPTTMMFMEKFELLDRHVPSTGFAAILDMLACEPASLYVTGFDFFASGVHNVDERWRPGDPNDPIGHEPDLEAHWLMENAERYPLTFDTQLRKIIRRRRSA